jgi:hypothetical protein
MIHTFINSCSYEELDYLKSIINSKMQELGPDLTQSEIELWRNGNKISALKALRERMNLSLKDAKDRFESVRMIQTMKEQEQAAIGHNMSYVCMLYKKDGWYIDVGFTESHEALMWFDERPTITCRVWCVSKGKAALCCSR